MPKHYSISASRDGWRRAGRIWNTRPSLVAADELTDAQLSQLREDPAVTVLEADEAGKVQVAPPPEPAARRLTLDEARAELLRAGIRALDPGSGDHFTSAGSPDIAALRKATGLSSISAAARDEAWAAHQADAPAGEQPA